MLQDVLAWCVTVDQVPEVLQRFFRRMIQDRSQFNVSKIAGALFTVFVAHRLGLLYS